VIQIAQEEVSKMKKEECCNDPKLIGFPREHPVVDICMTCGKWNYKNTSN
jgi:hypothetical protein